MKKLLTAALCLSVLAGARTLVCAQEPEYVLRDRGGMIAYYDCTHGGWQSTGCPVSALPNATDRAALSCGLPLYSREALTRALEDFCS